MFLVWGLWGGWKVGNYVFQDVLQFSLGCWEVLLMEYSFVLFSCRGCFCFIWVVFFGLYGGDMVGIGV